MGVRLAAMGEGLNTNFLGDDIGVVGVIFVSFVSSSQEEGGLSISMGASLPRPSIKNSSDPRSSLLW